MPAARFGKNLLLALLLALTIIGPGTGTAAAGTGTTASVSWARLPYYLESRGVEPDRKLPLCDCPRGINEKNPTHHVLQVIANTLYEWREYRFTDAAGRGRLALIMNRPRKQTLSAEEARVLLTASAEWQKQNPIPNGRRSTTRAIDPATTCRIPTNNEESRSARAAGLDNLETIDPVRLEQFPCNTIACLDISDRGSPYRGTGFQVSPYCFLTAGHNIFWKDHWVDSITVIPAQYPAGNGDKIIEPYGRQLCPQENLRTNLDFTRENSTINISEFDYGAIFLKQPFADIKTFMPLEFHYPGQALPNQVEIAGYPLYPTPALHASYAAWSASGQIYNSPDGNYQQFIWFTAPIFGGNSGSPVCYKNLLGQVRVIGITTWRNLSTPGGGGTLLTSLNEELIRSWLAYTPVSRFSQTGYIPYFCNREGTWTGLALANPNPKECQVKVEYFAADGNPVGSQYLEIKAFGQSAFACTPNQDPYCATGWLKISATCPVYGFALVGRNAPSTMFDIDLQTRLQQKMLFPHLVATGDWHSTVITCNPDPQAPASLQFTCLLPDGTRKTAVASIPAGGSLNLDLEKLFRQPLAGGQLILNSSRPISAFLLYSNTTNDVADPNKLWQAGLSAIPFDSTD